MTQQIEHTVIIPVLNELKLLEYQFYQFEKCKHELIIQKNIIVFQGGDADFDTINNLYSEKATIIRTPPYQSGYAIDIALKQCTTKYATILDADAFPFSKNWLYKPIMLLEKYGFFCVGIETGLHHSYGHMGNFFCINNNYETFNADSAKLISEAVGWSNSTARKHLEFENKSFWGDVYADNGVIAQAYADQSHINFGDKMSLPITHNIGLTATMGIYGFVIDNMVFHFVFGSHMAENKDVLQSRYGDEYVDFLKFVEAAPVNDETISKILSMIQPKNGHLSKIWYNKYKHFHELKSDSPVSQYSEKLNTQ